MSSCNDPCADNISIIVDTGSRGQPGPPGPAAKVLEWTYYLNPGDTIISGDDASAKPLAYTPDSVQVYLNGVQLSKRDDYTTDEDGLSIVLNEAIVNANDIMVIVSQVPPDDYDPTNDHNRLQGQIDDNKEAIDGLDVRVTANETAIENLEGLADGFTTRDVKVSGVNTTRSVDQPLRTQMDVNLYLDQSIADAEERIDTIEGGQPDQTQDIKDLREDVDENTQGISDNATALNDLVDVVEDSTKEIDGLQTQIDQLPPPADISDLEQDVDGLVKSVGTNTIAIAKNTADIAALDKPVDLDPLNAAIATNASGINQNAKDIVSLKATDATLTGKVNDLEAAVGDLEAIDIPEDIAFTNVDNAFDTAQTIKDGLNITGNSAFIEMDRGTALTVSNNNAYNSVIEIERSSGDVSLQLQADGQIRGVKTDGTDDTSAVSVGWFQDNVGAGSGDVDLSKYATKLALSEEETARIIGDEKLAADLANAILTEKYNDTALTNRIAAEEKARAAGDSTLSGKIANETQYRKAEDAKLQAAIEAIEIPEVDLEGYATEDFVTEVIADFATENFVEEAIGAIELPELPEGLATETYVAEAIDAIEFPAGTVISDTAPVDPEEGATWYDTVRLELFVFASGSWLPSSPLGARVEQGEVLQSQILSRVEAGEEAQDELQHKVRALEGAVGEHTLSLTVLNSNPRPGEFNLKDGSLQLTTSLSQADYITLSRTDKDGNTIDLNRITEGDVLRLSDEIGETAELKITASADGVCSYKKISGELEDLAADGEPLQTAIDFVLLSSFDPEGLATIDYVDGLNSGSAKLNAVNVFTKSNEFMDAVKSEKSVYAKQGFVSNGKPSSTVLEVKGENESMSEKYVKIRGSNRLDFICYPGQSNSGYRKALSLEWDAESDNPKVFIDHLSEPKGGGQAVNKRFLDQEISKIEEAVNKNAERTWSWQPEPANLHSVRRVYWCDTDSGYIRFLVAGENYRDNIQFANNQEWRADAKEMLTITGIQNNGKVGILAYGLVSRFQMYDTFIQLECEPDYVCIFKPDMFKKDHKITVKYGSLLS